MTELSERQKAEIQRLQDIINTPVPWWKASGCLWLLLAFFALAAIGLAIALPLAILLPKARSGAPVVYDGPVLAGNLEVLSAAGQIINFQVLPCPSLAATPCYSPPFVRIRLRPSFTRFR